VPGPAAIRRILRTTFGLDRLREGQEAVIASVMRGKPTLAVMPTGAGQVALLSASPRWRCLA
jgi:ATP-dependent DNA helicase RecQ